MGKGQRVSTGLPASIRVESITDVSDQIRLGRRSCVQTVEHCLGRIDELESHIRAWVIVDRQGALAQARRLDEELAQGRWRGLLHGIPIGIKDIVDVQDFPTAAGSRLWAQEIATEDATIVERLRRAGAVILGKTVTTQYACFDPPITCNPWNAQRTPGGSSSGSAAAVACGMCLGAIGSQTGGSITRPASYCGVAGCKPSYGRVSTAGVRPLAPSMDHPGPIAHSVRDLAILLEAIAGPDERDPLCATVPAPKLVASLDSPSALPSRIGVVRGIFEDLAELPVRRLIQRVIETLTAKHAVVRELALPASFNDVLRSHRAIMAVEAAAIHQQRLAEHPDDYQPRIRQLIEEGLATTAPQYVRAKWHQQSVTREIGDSFRDVDVLLTPATLGPPPDISTTGDPAFNSPWSFTGLPTVSFPVTLTDDGLPLAIQLVGHGLKEVELFRCALWCEQNLRDLKGELFNGP